MHDDDIEGVLKKYRPAPPERAFDERLLQSLESAVSRVPEPRTWPWAVAAAALLAITIGLHAVSMAAPATGGEGLDARRVQALADEIGGPQARAMAEYIVRQEQRADEEAEQMRAKNAPREAVGR